MTLYILDPNLAHIHGHHLEWDLSIANAALERGQNVVILTHVGFNVAVEGGIKIVPHFTHTTYEKKSVDPTTARYDDFQFFNDSIFCELCAWPTDPVQPRDTVLVPTLNENHLLGYIAWMKTFEPTLAPLFVVYLMFSPGLDIGSDGEFLVVDELSALFYQLAFRHTHNCQSFVKFFGGGRQMAREFSALIGYEVEPHAVPLCPIRRRPPGKGGRKQALLFAGDAKIEKGLTLLPDLVASLCATFPNWDFVVHVNTGSSWGEALNVCERLAAEAPSFTNFRLHVGRLNNDAYIALLENVHCVVFPYDPITYARKSSGILWETISLGTPVLVPDQCWLAEEVAEWAGGYLAYAPYTVDAITEAFEEFAKQIDSLRDRATVASHRYQASNGPHAVLDQVADLWASRFTPAFGAPPKPRLLAAADITGAGWYDVENDGDAVVRWTSTESEIRFEWPYNWGWQIAIDVRKYSGVEQLQTINAIADGKSLPVKYELLADNYATLLINGGRSRPKARGVCVRLTIPKSRNARNKTKQLGILVGGIVIRPAAPPDDFEFASTPSVYVLTPVTWNSSDTAFLMRDSVSGVAVLHPSMDAEFTFNIDTDAGPDAVRALRFFVNGCLVRVTETAMGSHIWAAVADCPSQFISKGGYKTDWDMSFDGKVPAAGIWIRKFTVREKVPEAASTLMKNSKIKLSGRLTMFECGSDRIAPKGIFGTTAIGRGGAHASVRADARLRTELSAMKSNDFVAVEGLNLNQYHISNEYRHLDISLLSAVFRGVSWPHIKFKFALYRGERSIELRKGEGLPEMLMNWPGDETDEYGLVLRLRDDAASVKKIDRWPEPSDQLLIKLIMVILPFAVERAAGDAKLPVTEVAAWRKEALSLSTNFLRLIGEDVAQTEIPSIGT
jgi:glycosyltransferase involved in cell wall biosynthesis